MAVVEDWTPSMTSNATLSAPAEGVSFCGLRQGRAGEQFRWRERAYRFAAHTPSASHILEFQKAFHRFNPKCPRPNPFCDRSFETPELVSGEQKIEAKSLHPLANSLPRSGIAR